jgi:glutamyl-tRNA reductase
LIAADIVIASTAAQRPVLTMELVKPVQKARRGRPLTILDIALPRDVEPEVGELGGIYLAGIDDLQNVASEHREKRETEAAEAEEIVAEEVGRFLKKWRGRQLGPVVTAFRKHVLELSAGEAQRLCAMYPGMADNEKRRVSELAESIAKRLLHLPQMALRDDEDDGVPLVLALQRLFKLDVAPAPAVVETAAAATAGAQEETEETEKKATGR